MATITNTQARLIWGPDVQGHQVPQWLPGKNRLDSNYWRAAQNNADVKRWIKLGWIVIDEDEEIPDPKQPPSDAELAEFTEGELRAALAPSSQVPVQWHPALEAELARRASAPKPAEPAPVERKSLSGLRVDEALPLIENETDVDTLEAWANADKRKSIDEAIDKRLVELAFDED